MKRQALVGELLECTSGVVRYVGKDEYGWSTYQRKSDGKTYVRGGHSGLGTVPAGRVSEAANKLHSVRRDNRLVLHQLGRPQESWADLQFGVLNLLDL